MMKFMFIFLFMFIISMFMLSSWVFMVLWNYIAPLFWVDAPILSYLQSCCVVALLSFIGSCFKK